MDKSVFVLMHSYEYGDNNEYTETKLIGAYSSLEKAKETVNKLKNGREVSGLLVRLLLY